MSGEDCLCLYLFNKYAVRGALSQHSRVMERGSLRCEPCVLMLSVSCGCCQAVPIHMGLQTQPRVPMGAKRGCWHVSNKNVCRWLWW